MNFWEAYQEMKKGKEVIREDEPDRVYRIHNGMVTVDCAGVFSPCYAGRAFLEDNFKTKEKTITITESQFDEAYEKSLSGFMRDVPANFRDRLKKELGF